MSLAAAQLAELINRKLCQRICDSANGKRNKQLVGVQARIVISEVLYFQVLDRLDDAGSNEQQLLVNAGKLFKRVHKACRGCTEQRACFAGNYRSVRQLNADSRSACFLRTRVCGGDYGTVG